MSWFLHLGIHRGTITSRDAESPRPFDTLEECRDHAEVAVAAYRRMGCRVWFCYADSPVTGQRHTLFPSEEYAR